MLFRSKWWALKALLFLRRENKKLRDTLAQRFKLWESGDYKGLVDLFAKACAPRPLPRPHNDSEPLRQRRALRLFGEGHFSKGIRLVAGHGTGDPTDMAIQAQVRDKFVKRTKQLPLDLPQANFKRVKINNLHQVYHGLQREAGPGPDGMRNEFLMVLTRNFADPLARSAIKTHEAVAERFLNDELPPWFYHHFTSINLVYLVKKEPPAGITPDVRPIGMGNVERRAWMASVVRSRSSDLGEELRDIQTAVGVRGGTQLLSTAINLHLGLYEDHACIKLDLKNAFGLMSRSEMLKALLESPAFRDLYPVMWACFWPASPVVGLDGVTSEEGGQQGDVAIPGLFSLALHPDLKWANEKIQKECPTAGIRAVMDDIYAFGPLEVIIPIVDKLKDRLLQRSQESSSRRSAGSSTGTQTSCGSSSPRTLSSRTSTRLPAKPALALPASSGARASVSSARGCPLETTTSSLTTCCPRLTALLPLLQKSPIGFSPSQLSISK